MLLEELVSIGFEREEAQYLAENNGFHHREKNRDELIALFNEISNVYGFSFIDIKKAILSFPQFAGLDHRRVVKEALEIYGDEERVKKAVLVHPPFAGYDHRRVVSQKTKLGRIAELSDKEVINYILDSPALAGYSVKRYLAAFDIGRQLEKEGFTQNKRMLDVFFSNRFYSPYVPNTKRRRISQIDNYEEPKLLTHMRKRLERFKK